MGDRQRREFQGALFDGDCFEELPGKCRPRFAGRQNRPKLQVVGDD
jgi:hypothetical protein